MADTSGFFTGSNPAIGQSTFAAFGSAAADIFAGFGAQSKAQGDIAEATNYGLAAKFALQEAAFTKESTAIGIMQAERQSYQAISGTRAEISGAGFSAGGSGLDILASSAGQAALQQAVIARQGLITEKGYDEQAQSYKNMEAAANMAASAENKAAFGSFLAGGIQGAAGAAPIAEKLFALAAL